MDNKELEYRKEIFKLKAEIRKIENNLEDKVNYHQNLINDYEIITNSQKQEIEEQRHKIESIINSRSWKLIEKTKQILGRKPAIKVVEKKEYYDKTDKNNYHNFPVYSSFFEKNQNFSKYNTDIKVLAFYLPQYHYFKENDEWWGKNFTEWTNVKKAAPKFDGHYQPRKPHDDFGYYLLDDIRPIKKQIELAKEHGVFGFCYYYYWFSGKRLMEKPMDLFLQHTDLDFPFCICWANENFTRTWDGKEQNILIKQDYAKEDGRTFINDLQKYLKDKRYIKVNGKPLLLVYNPSAIPEFNKLVLQWREYARDLKIGELEIWVKSSVYNNAINYIDVIDGEFDFPPNEIEHRGDALSGVDRGNVYNYKKMVENIMNEYDRHFSVKKFYYSAMLGWDNSARRKEGFTTFLNYNSKTFYDWIQKIIQITRNKNDLDDRFIFINAWNEWAEGTYLEPDEKYGYDNINTLSRAIFDLSEDK